MSKVIDREKDYQEKMEEALLKHVAGVAEDELFAELEENEEEFVFSERHEKQMAELFASVSPQEKKRRHPAIKVLLMAAVLLIVSAVATVAFNPKVLNFFTKSTETNTEIRHEEIGIAEADKVEGTYTTEDLTLGYVPKGMQFVSNERDDKQVTLKFQEEDKFFMLRVWKKDMVYNLDNQQSSMEKILINNKEGFMQEREGNFSVKWYSEEYTYALLGNLEKDEMIKIAENIQ